MSFETTEIEEEHLTRTSRRTYTGLFKAKVVADALTNKRDLKELAAYYNIHPNQIKNWKCTLLKRMDEIFEDKRRLRSRKQARPTKNNLYQKDPSRHHPEHQDNETSTAKLPG